MKVIITESQFKLLVESDSESEYIDSFKESIIDDIAYHFGKEVFKDSKIYANIDIISEINKNAPIIHNFIRKTLNQIKSSKNPSAYIKWGVSEIEKFVKDFVSKKTTDVKISFIAKTGLALAKDKIKKNLYKQEDNPVENMVWSFYGSIRWIYQNDYVDKKNDWFGKIIKGLEQNIVNTKNDVVKIIDNNVLK